MTDFPYVLMLHRRHPARGLMGCSEQPPPRKQPPRRTARGARGAAPASAAATAAAADAAAAPDGTFGESGGVCVWRMAK